LERTHPGQPGRGAEITDQFNDLEVLVPSSASPTAAHAKWKLTGSITIRTRDNEKKA